MLPPVKLDSYSVKKIWGSNRLGPNIGELWIYSDIEESYTTIEGKKINLWLEEKSIDPYDFYGVERKAHFLIKLIEAKEFLSIQLHPKPKNECWYILDADEKNNAGIYLGVKKGITINEIKQAYKDTRLWTKILEFIPVKKGDFYYVQAGMIHAIGPNVYLAEIQNPIDCTYRLWDWGRDRLIHQEESLNILNTLGQLDQRKANVPMIESFKDDDYSFDIIRIEKNESKIIEFKGEESCNIVLCLKGNFRFNQNILLEKDAYFIPASFRGSIKFIGLDQTSNELLIVRNNLK